MVAAESSRTKGKSRFVRKISLVENRLKTVDLNISAHSQQNTVDKNLHVGNNKVNRPNNSSKDIVSNIKTVDFNISAHSQQSTVDKNLHVGNNKVNRPNNTRLDHYLHNKRLNKKASK